ncbi:16S rRNA (adenine(1518)-N(6)/adenine(1519)-N(6))-dimethyltransferase RsmA [Aurantimonas marianensis]|uniref:Ribosomal RNA small subunit methyltransferase A n=1 Tax=Aurantimonas marianensis TaxID=2920428 RepID=A0A9X2HEZ3_9HYPH|nr:16S rRNA (adenine(1518)-N(6)/adenine(1519)-N(6))-dimethyltransferase RsmA [Aurantimonas marianensis]MCP3056389.1 16S rRNA (adenine(1518)-N(6)/adenine(1519)-N(6))-dimethyltransferase RsmA [Aurantimonas marianensis]
MSSPDGLPPLRAVMLEHGLDPKRGLGQNFLLDLNLTARIARQAHPLAGATIVEIGPGPGGLTRALLAEGADRVIAIEKDARCLPALKAIADHYPGRLEIIEADALTIDLAALAHAGPLKIVANLPYNVGTQLLLNWIATARWPPMWSSLTLMFQREVAERIVAAPGSDHYGRLGVLTGWRTRARILFDISREAFTPPPKVTSSVVHLLPIADPEPASLDALERVTAAAFGQRRKMLRQSLKPLGGEALLEAAEIDPRRRAETLTVSEFVRLANHIRSA